MTDRELLELAAKAMYCEYVNNADIHCNRFPSWEELSEAGKSEWRKSAAAAIGAKGEM